MSDERQDDYSTTIRDAYGFPVHPAYISLHQQFSPLWGEEEAERTTRWEAWLQRLRYYEAKDVETSQGNDNFVVDDAEVLLDRALRQYSGSLNPGPYPPALLQQLRALVQMGVPMSRRAQFWKLFLSVDGKKEEAQKGYATLVAEALSSPNNTVSTEHSSASSVLTPHDEEFPVDVIIDVDSGSNPADSDSDGRHRPSSLSEASQREDWLAQIEKDLHRTFPDHPLMDSHGRNALRRILAAYSQRNHTVGYCQGLNFLAAAFLLLVPEEEAFWCVTVMVEDLLPGYFDTHMVAPQVDAAAFSHLLRGSAPRVAAHLEELQVDATSATSAWFLVAFLNSLPLETCLRVWDVFFFERSPVVLFRVALALMDIYGPALLETDDSSEAYLLLQALGPMSYDSSRLIDTASIGYGHIKDSALRVLRDKYRPGVMESMRTMFSCDEELEGFFIAASTTPSPLSRSQSFAKAVLSSTPPPSAGASQTGLEGPVGGSRRDLTPAAQSRRPPSPRSPIIIGPKSRSNRASLSENGRISPATSDPAPPQASIASHPPSTGNNAALIEDTEPKQPFLMGSTSVMCTPPRAQGVVNRSSDDGHQGWQTFPQARRTRSAVPLGARRSGSSSSHHRFVPHRIDLSSLASFVPDLTRPGVAAVYKIATQVPRKKNTNRDQESLWEQNATLEKQCGGRELYNGRRNAVSPRSLPVSTVVRKLDDLARLGQCKGAGDKSGATIDIGSLAMTIRALRFGESTNRTTGGFKKNYKESGSTVDNGDSGGERRRVPRRFTDGGALLLAPWNRHGTSPLEDVHETSEVRSLCNPDFEKETVVRLQQLRDLLAEEVSGAVRRQRDAETAAAEVFDTAEALERHLAKIQADIDRKIDALQVLYARIADADGALAAMRTHQQGRHRDKAEAQEKVLALRDQTASKAAVIKVLMEAVSQASSTPPVSPRKQRRP